MKKQSWGLLGLIFLLITQSFAQNSPSSVLYHDLLRFQETKRILYIAAHPDDENTRLIAYLANAEHAEVAYLSLTRGDGGQNLIGKELGIELGMIRTNELLRARETDGGRQFFSRALDFGFSKHPDETFNNWDREKLLSDVVWVIRNFQPDIVINRFNTAPGTTHGHHTSSAILSTEAFEKAADPKVFPEQLEHVSIWKPKRLFWNAYSWGGQYEPEEGKVFHRFSVGELNPLLGATYSQIAADSRTMHKSQGFGSTAQLGEANDYVEMIKGESFSESPFEGIPSRWKSLSNGDAIQDAIDVAVKNFDVVHPVKNLDNLLAIKKLLDKSNSKEKWLFEKQEDLDELLLGVLGFRTEFVVKKEIGFPGEKLTTELVVNNPSDKSLLIKGFQGDVFSQKIDKTISKNKPLTQEINFGIPSDYGISQPFWLENPLDNSLFGIEDKNKIGPPVNAPIVSGKLTIEVDGSILTMLVPLEYKYNDQVKGEVRQPFTLVPEINVNLDKANLFVIEGADQRLNVEVSFRDNIKAGKLVIEGLESNQYKIESEVKDDRRSRIFYTIEVHDAKHEKQKVLVSYQTTDGRKFNQDTKRILYDHIPNLTYFTSSEINVVKMDLSLSGMKIGYIPGAGDDVPEVLKSLGYEVTLLENGDLSKRRLKEFPTVIVGIRAFNVNQNLASNVDQVMEYVKEGGNLIVQYNTSSPLLTRDMGPYPFSLSRDRVTVEESPVKASYSHSILSQPNQVKESDFEGWVQERGLYFTSDWDSNYSTPLAMHDPGEKTSEGSLLHTKYGEGTYTYSGISWFRQLPAGVPGAVKIFVNLIEQGGKK